MPEPSIEVGSMPTSVRSSMSSDPVRASASKSFTVPCGIPSSSRVRATLRVRGEPAAEVHPETHLARAPSPAVVEQAEDIAGDVQVEG